MPGVAWAAIIIWGTLTGSALLGPPKVWDGADPSMNKHPHYKRDAVQYRTWTSSPRRDKKGVCTFTVFALVTQEKVMRLRVGGVEQLVDWSWSWEAEIPENRSGTGVVEFIDPVTHEVVATHEVYETCWPMVAR